MSPTAAIAASIRRQATNVLKTGQRFKSFNQVRCRHFWSTMRFYADATGYVESGEYDFFQTPQGMAGQGFNFPTTLRESNWLGANRVPDNENLIVSEFGLTALTVNLQQEVGDSPPPLAVFNSYAYPNLENQILDNGILNIVYLTNSVSLGLGTDFSQACGPTNGFYAPNMPQTYPLPSYATDPEGFKEAATDKFRTLVTNGIPAPALRRKLTIPLLLQHGETFKFSLTIPAGRGGFMWPPQADIVQEQISSDFAVDVRLEFWAIESFVE